jgi:hypothetical protein
MSTKQAFLALFFIPLSHLGYATSQVSQVSLSSVSDISAAHSGTSIQRFQVDDDEGDFRLSLKSEAGGKYILDTSLGIDDGDYQAYTIDLVYTEIGTLGRSTSSPMTNLNIATTKNIDYNESPTGATSAAKFDIKINTSANDMLFEGTFVDTINITISPL